MFKCSICGKEYSDKDTNEVRLLNRQTNELETYHVCGTCLDNKEDMVAYLAEKKKMSREEARHLYDYFVPLLENIEEPLLEKYVESRVRSLRAKLSDGKEDEELEETPKVVTKKKMSVFQRLKVALVTSAAVLGVIVFTLSIVLCAVVGQTGLGVFLGLSFGVGLFVALYFVIDNYVRLREENHNMIKKVADLIPDKEEEANE